MIALLMAVQVAVVAKADRVAFEDYRQCVLQVARATTSTAKPRALVEKAESDCHDARLAAELEITADDLEAAGDLIAPSNSDARMAVLTDELV